MEVDVNFTVFKRNLDRVDALCNLYSSIKHLSDIRSTDILRAAVVFLHASQEDYYRGILTDALLRFGERQILGKVPLYNTGGRSEKFTLGSIAKYEDLTVKELISLSVKQYMERTSFNSYDSIVSWMKIIGVDCGAFSDGKQVNNLILRRHKIVHEVDLAQGNRNATAAIDIRTVLAWKNAVDSLVSLINQQIHDLYVQSQEETNIND